MAQFVVATGALHISAPPTHRRDGSGERKAERLLHTPVNDPPGLSAHTPAEASAHAAAAPSVGPTVGDEVGEVTRILRAGRDAGDASDRATHRPVDRELLDRIVPLIYDDLRRLARRQLAREHGARSIQATTLVHEAYLKLAGSAPRAADRAHLLAIAAHAMRQVLVDHARANQAAKRGAGWVNVTLTDVVAPATLDPASFLALNDAIARLEPRQRTVVECRFFGGMDDAEIAEALGVTDRTVRREWVKARAWLNRWLHEGPGA